jgi:trk system potassium uptake protein TrkH
MLIRPLAEDFRIIGYQLGRIFLVVAAASVLPLTWAILDREWGPAASFLLMSGVLTLLGTIGLAFKPRVDRLEWSHGMVVVALTWLLVPAVGSIPLALSGQYVNALDAFFDAMSGLSTTGLSLINDLDHLAPALNFWRHLLHFLGGQGIIIAALSLFAGSGLMTLYRGEAREERILPSVTSTARFIWAVSLVHLLAGVAALSAVAWIALGFTPGRSLYHGLLVFMASFDTGGFAPQSTSIGYYHSGIFEAVTGVLMVAGAISFGLHFALWRGPRRGILRNLETRTILGTFALTSVLTIIGLVATGVFTGLTGLGRQGFFQVLSAHTGTGFSTIPSAELAAWGGLAFAGMALAMSLGGMGSSTAGGVKALRVGITIRALATQVTEVLLPERAVVPTVFHQNGRRRLTAEIAQSAMIISLLYVGLYLLGAAVALAYGIPLKEALFESVSAGANVGLSMGVTDPSMPVMLKLTYILQMWAGRLEFLAIFSLFGFIWAWIRGK